MSTSVDERVVDLRFNNAQFESAAAQSMTTLQHLDQALKLESSSKGLNALQKGLSTVSFAHMSEGIDAINKKFSAIGILGLTEIHKIADKITSVFNKTLNELTVAPVSQGFKEYELKMASVQTIMASTGESVETVNKYLEELNAYSDKTIYSFSDMTNSIGKFTNAGVDLDTAVKAIKGISNEAAVSGANANEASRAMYNFAQALSSGYVKLVDWKSIEVANMATKEFKDELLKTAAALGTVEKQADGTYRVFKTDSKGVRSLSKDVLTATQGFNNSLQEGWMTTEVLTKTLGKYADTTTELGKKAFAAAQDIKTYSMLMDTLKEAVGSGWSQTFEIMFGNLEEAKELWTAIGNTVGDFIERVSNARNTFLKGVLGEKFMGTDDIRRLIQGNDLIGKMRKALKGTSGEFKFQYEGVNSIGDALIALAKNNGIAIDEMMEGGKSVFDTLKNGWLTAEIFMSDLDKLGTTAANTAEYMKVLDEMSNKVIRGDFGNGAERVKKLTEAGYKYNDVQSVVNHKLLGWEIKLEEVSDEQLKSIGYTEKQIEVLRFLQKEAKETGTPLNELIEQMSKPTGRTLLIQALANSFRAASRVIGDVSDTLKEVFGTISSRPFYNAIERFEKFSETLMPAAAAASKDLKDGFKGLAMIVKLGIDGVSASLNYLVPILGSTLRRVLGITIKKFGDLGRYLQKLAPRIRDYANKLVEAISGQLRNLGDFLSRYVFPKFLDTYNNLKDTVLEPLLKRIKEFIKKGAQNLLEFIPTITDRIVAFYKKIKPVLDVISKLYGKVKDFVSENLPKVIETIKDKFDKFKETVEKFIEDHINISGLKEGIGGAIQNLWQSITDIANSDQPMVTAFSNIGGAVRDFAGEVANAVSQNVQLNDVFESIRTHLEKVGGYIHEFVTVRIPKAFGTLGDKFKEIGEKLKQLPIIGDIFGKLSQGIEDIKSKGLITWVIEALSDLKGALESLYEGSDQLNPNTGMSKSALINLQQLIEPFHKLLSMEYGDSKEIYTNFRDSISAMVHGLTDGFEGFNWTIVENVLKLISAIWLIYQALITVRSLKMTFTDFDDLINKLAGILSKAGGVLKAVSKQIEAQAFVSYAKALAIVVGAMYVLGSLPEDKIYMVAHSMTMLLLAFAALMFAWGKWTEVSSKKKMAEEVAKDMGEMKDSVKSISGSISGMFNTISTGISDAIKAFGKAAGQSLLLISATAAILILIETIRLIANITPAEMQRGGIIIGILAVCMIAFTALMGIIARLAEGNLNGGFAAVIIASIIALKLIVGMIQEVTHIPPKALSRAAGALVDIMALMALMAAILYFGPTEGTTQSGAGLILAAIAIRMMVKPLKQLAQMEGDVKGASTALLVAAGALAIVVVVLGHVGSRLSAVGMDPKPLIGIALAIVMVAGAFALLSTVDPLKVVGMSIAMTLLLAALATLAQFIGMASEIILPGIAIFATLSVALLALGIAALAFGAGVALAATKLPPFADGLIYLCQKIAENGPAIIEAVDVIITSIIMVIAARKYDLAITIVAVVGYVLGALMLMIQTVGPENLRNIVGGLFDTLVQLLILAGEGLINFFAVFMPEFVRVLVPIIINSVLSILRGLWAGIVDAWAWFCDTFSTFSDEEIQEIYDSADSIMQTSADSTEKWLDNYRSSMSKYSPEDSPFYKVGEAAEEGADETVGKIDESGIKIQNKTDEWMLRMAGQPTELPDPSYYGIFDQSENIDAGTEATLGSMDSSGLLMTGKMEEVTQQIMEQATGEMGLPYSVNEAWSSTTEAMNSGSDGFVTATEESAEESKSAVQALSNSVVVEAQNQRGPMYSAGSEDGRYLGLGMADGLESSSEHLSDKARSVFSKLIESARDVLGIHSPSKVFEDMGRASAEGYGEGIKAAGPAAQRQVAELFNGTLERISRQNSKWRVAATMAAGQFSSGLRSKSQEAKRAGTQIASAAKSGVGSIQPRQWETVGQQLVAGLIRGINSKAKAARNAAANVATQALNKLKSVPQISSPSKVTTRYGEYFGQGWVNGITSMTRVSEVAASNLAEDSISAMQESVKKINDLMLEPLELDPTIRPVLDLTDVQNGAAQLGGMLNMRAPVQVGGFLNQKDVMSEMVDVLRLDMRNRRLAAAGGGGTTYNITVNAPTGNARDIAREIERIIVRR